VYTGITDNRNTAVVLFRQTVKVCRHFRSCASFIVDGFALVTEDM